MLMMLLVVAEVDMGMVQVVRARVVGDLPVALGIDEMVRQVRAAIPWKELYRTALQVKSIQGASTMGFYDRKIPQVS